MPLDFPNTPSNGSTYTADGVTWQYDGEKWIIIGSGTDPVAVSASPPTSPGPGDAWFDTDSGTLLVYYDGFWVAPSVNYSIGTAAVGTAQIADANVTTAKIADGAVTAAKLANPILLGFHSLGTAQATTSTHTNFQAEGLTKSITYAANRILRITLIVNPYPSGGSQGIIYRLRRGSTTLTSFQILPEEFNTNNATARTYTHIFNGPATGGTETFSVEFRASSTNAAVTSYAGDQGTGGTWYRQLIVEDLGPQ